MRREYAILVFVTFVWGSGHPIGKLILEEIHPIQLSMLSAVLTMVALTVIMTFSRDLGKIKKLDQRGFLLSVASGLLIFFTYPILSFSALQRIPASVNSILVAISTIFVAIIAYGVLGEKLSSLNYLGIGASFIGVYFVIMSSGSSLTDIGDLSLIGATMSLMAALVAALHTIVGKKAVKNYDAISITLVASFVGVILQLVNTSFFVGFNEIVTITTPVLLYILYWGVFSGIGYFLFYWCMKGLEASRVAVFIYLSPLFAVILSFMILHEEIRILLILGMVLIFGGVRLTQRKKK